MARSLEPNGLTCEVCGNSLTGKQRRACSSKCRSALGTKDSADRAELTRRVAEHEVTRAVREALLDEAGPVVREALTDEVLKSIRTMVFLIPQAIAGLQTNLASEDPEVRQKAATTLLRYTMGNPSVAPPSLEQTPAPLQVHFNVPQSGTVDAAVIEVEGDVEDEKECMECHSIKPLSQFVGRSDRCEDCHRRLTERVESEYGRVALG